MKAARSKFGKRIRELRQRKGMTQQGLAERCGFHRNRIGRIERGQIDVALGTILTLAETLELSVSSLFRNLA